jgi:hypothetical protein
MLSSLARLLLAAGRSGLVLHLDCARLAESRPAAARAAVGRLLLQGGGPWTRSRCCDKLIDATDELRGVLVVAVLPPELVTDEARGLPSYSRPAAPGGRRGT